MPTRRRLLPLPAALLVALLAAGAVSGFAPPAPPFSPHSHSHHVSRDVCLSAATSLWRALDSAKDGEDKGAAFHAIFGPNGERGEYMDGYTRKAMEARCREDYGWTMPSDWLAFEDDDARFLAFQRAEMMAHLYGAPELYGTHELWEHVALVAFAEHYVLCESDVAEPWGVFCWEKERQAEQDPERPIFGGVVLGKWEQSVEEGKLDERLEELREERVDYVRLECNFGVAEEIGDPSRLADDAHYQDRFRWLAMAAKACQDRQLVPLALLQVPWRESKDESAEYFAQAIECFANAARDAGVEMKRLLLETRPPVGMSAREERGLDNAARRTLGLNLGRQMFHIIDKSLEGERLAGFCVAGGSTKGANPTAMEDDVQNCVRQGMRQSAMREWGYELCFWEMGAKLMLQPEIGRLWAKEDGAGYDEARELFCANAKALAEEIAAPIES